MTDDQRPAVKSGLFFIYLKKHVDNQIGLGYIVFNETGKPKKINGETQ